MSDNGVTPAAIAKYMRRDEIVERFAETLGQGNAGPYITSVLLAVNASEKLQECTLQSIAASALRAASLRLSVDPDTGQAYLVPFKVGGVMTCTLIVGYKGLYDMAVRTGRYRYIHVAPMHEGAVVTEDPITGFHKIEEVGDKNGRIVGWLGSFQMMNGYSKTIYLSVEEVQAHGKRYSKTYDRPDSKWKTEPAKMERKTVLRILLRKWGYLDPTDASLLAVVEHAEDEAIEAEFNLEEPSPEAEAQEVTPRTEAQRKAELGFGNGDHKPDPADAFRKRAKALGVDKETADAILAENAGDFEASLAALERSWAPVAEGEEAAA